MKAMTSGQLGAKAEKLAAKHLKKNGYRILEKNLRMKVGEIDILARHEDILVIVEVKAGKAPFEFGAPELRVGRDKRAKLRNLASSFLQKHRMTETDVRFDVVTVCFSDKDTIVRIIENAFW
jgi:putative endonuclease